MPWPATRCTAPPGRSTQEAAITGQPAVSRGGRSLSCLRHRRLPQGRINAVVSGHRRASRVNNGIGDAPDERPDRRYGHPLQDGPVQRGARLSQRWPGGTRQAEHRGILAQRGEFDIGIQDREQHPPGPMACHRNGSLTESQRSTSSLNRTSTSLDTPGAGPSGPTRAPPGGGRRGRVGRAPEARARCGERRTGAAQQRRLI